ncbi:hypothetical protein WR25_16809 isoform B [Diploscapter pachys]|uniref:Uncharacterized protein n=1 Tax=Diploscapter pachys TaxID=2018661 RepID=A0A2A2KZP3_9BILA|nr:hypothetical protein WR25_16809 isoform B [Diploscapter pachys]
MPESEKDQVTSHRITRVKPTFWRQFRWLLWKNILVKKRQKVWLTIEVFGPITFFIILALIRTKDFTVIFPQCHYDSKALPSAGLLPFMHSMLCSISNECKLSPSTGDEMRYINNVTGKEDESLMVEFFHYSTLQLKWIGKHPRQFRRLMTEITDFSNITAELNMINFVMPKQFSQLFLNSSRAAHRSASSLKLSPDLTAKLLSASPQPEFFNQISHINYNTMNMLFGSSDETLPMMCSRSLFEKSLYFPNGIEISNQELNKLCKIKVNDWINVVMKLQGDTNNQASMLLLNGTSIPYSYLATKLLNLMRLQEQPLFKGIQKWSNIGMENIYVHILGGVNGKDFFMSNLIPRDDGDKGKIGTPYDHIKNRLIEYIKQVVPGDDGGKNKACLNVQIQYQNCASVDSYFMRHFKPMIQGYILVTPDVPATRQLVDLVGMLDYDKEVWLEKFGILQFGNSRKKFT